MGREMSEEKVGLRDLRCLCIIGEWEVERRAVVAKCRIVIAVVRLEAESEGFKHLQRPRFRK